MSIATVSRVLSGRDPVSEGARARVLSAVRDLEYSPNALARSLREEATKTLGLVVPNVMNPFFAAVARAVEDAASERGYSVILCNADEDPDKEDTYLDVLLQKRVDGLIISPTRGASRRLGRLVSLGVPIVFVDRAIQGLGVPSVRVDGRKAVEELVGYLLGLGHERLAVISGPPETISGGERLETFRSGTEERGVRIPQEYLRFGDFRRESGRRAMRELLLLRRPPTAVFAANNLMCLGALQAIKEAGFGVPADVSIASFDDTVWFELMQPPITAISQPIRELGATAAQMLLGVLEKGYEPEPRVMDAELIVRGSCGPPADPP